MFPKIGLWLLILFSFIPAFAEWVPYTVQQGDTLGTIAKKTNSGIPVWGTNGSVTTIFEKNRPAIENPDLILTGQEILVPGNEELNARPHEQSEGGTTADESGETVQTDVAPVDTSSEETTTDGEPWHGKIKVGLLSSYWERQMVDKTSGASGTARSNVIYGLALDGFFPVSEGWDFTAGLLYRHIEFSKADNRTLVADTTDFFRLRSGALHTGETFDFGGGFQYEQLPLITGVNATTVGVSNFGVFSPFALGIWKALDYDKLQIGIGGILTYNLGATKDTYELQSGWTAELLFPITRTASKSLSYGLTPFAEYGIRETNTIEHTEVDLGVRADVIWNY